ncbi:hypothetical protein HWV62_43262, partial [Athelia sp. TMB]
NFPTISRSAHADLAGTHGMKRFHKWTRNPHDIPNTKPHTLLLGEGIATSAQRPIAIQKPPLECELLAKNDLVNVRSDRFELLDRERANGLESPQISEAENNAPVMD